MRWFAHASKLTELHTLAVVPGRSNSLSSRYLGKPQVLSGHRQDDCKTHQQDACEATAKKASDLWFAHRGEAPLLLELVQDVGLLLQHGQELVLLADRDGRHVALHAQVDARQSTRCNTAYAVREHTVSVTHGCRDQTMA